MSSMRDYHTPRLSLPAPGRGEGGDQAFIAFGDVSCGPVPATMSYCHWAGCRSPWATSDVQLVAGHLLGQGC
jgi:hypothetical protein